MYILYIYSLTRKCKIFVECNSTVTVVDGLVKVIHGPVTSIRKIFIVSGSRVGDGAQF